MFRFLFLFLVSFVANAATINLAWDEPADSRVLGYYLYRSNTAGSFTNPPIDVGKTSWKAVTGLATGVHHYFVLTSYALPSVGTLPLIFPRCVDPNKNFNTKLDGTTVPCENWSNELQVMIAPAVNTIPLDFGVLSLFYTSRTKVVQIINENSEPLAIMTVKYIGNGADFGPRGSTCLPGTVVQPQQSCTLAYVFRPTQPGQRSIKITATTTSDIYVLDMTGAGRGFVLQPETLDWGTVARGQYPEKTFTFKALWPLTINNMVKGGSAYIITNATCAVGMTMVKDQTCTVTAKMVGGTVGFKGGSMRFETNVGVGTVGFKATVQ